MILSVLLFASMFHHKPKPAPVDKAKVALIDSDRSMVATMAEKLPLWEADGVSRFERVEIATVKADIAVATNADTDDAFIAACDKLSDDWDSMCALDDTLKRENLI